MYNSSDMKMRGILILALAIASSASNSEVSIEKYSYTWLLGCKPTEDFSEAKIPDEHRSGAYSGELHDMRRVYEELEPIPPTAIYHIITMSLDTTGWISDDDLAKNISKFKGGQLCDDLCSDCGLSLLLHVLPKKHHCDVVKKKKDINEEEWANIQLSLVKRLSSMLLRDSVQEKKSTEVSITEKIVDNLSKLAEKINSINSNSPTPNQAPRTQVVARRNCPTWTAGTSVDVFVRWVNDWNKNDNSDVLIKYMDITKSLSENKWIPGLKDYMKKIVMPGLSATNAETVEAVLEKLKVKYKKNKFEEYFELLGMVEEFRLASSDNSLVAWERFLQLMEKIKQLKVEQNVEYFFLTMFLKKGAKAEMFSSFEENTLRNILGGEEEAQPPNVLKLFEKEFVNLKVQNHRTFSFETSPNEDSEGVHVGEDLCGESVHYGERGRTFHRGSRLIRSTSNPRLFRQARSQSWSNARSQSRSRPNQSFNKLVGTSYWYKKDDFKKPYSKDADKLDRILHTINKLSENQDALNSKVNSIEEKLKSVNYCEEEVREIHFTEDDKVDHQMIIDSGCPKTLAGERIIESYIRKHNLTYDQLIRKPCANIFKFGASRYPSHEIVHLPVKLPIKESINQAKDSFFATIETYIVKGDVPFLLGDNTMQNWQSKIDVANRVLELHKYKSDKGLPILLDAPLKGSHMIIGLQALKEKSLNESVKLNEEHVNLGEILTDFKNVRKMHEKLNHKSKANLAHAYANADLLTKELKETIQKVVDQCKVCQEYRKSMPRPAVTLPKCNDFNQIITLDFKIWGKNYILWMICSFTRFIKGVVIPNKEAETVINAVIQNWNCNFGIPSTGYWSDNGTEFKNAEMSEFCQKNGLSIKFGPAYSPWANGLNERNHASADKIIAKIMEDDRGLSLSDAVGLASWCHNTNIN